MALVAVLLNPETQEPEILAVGRLTQLHGVKEGEFAMLVSDPWHGQGLGSELLRRLVQIGRDETLETIRADILLQNRAMQRVCEKVGFQLRRTPSLVYAELQL
jgi:acetyltransferase